MADVFLSIGSNIDPEENLRLAVRELRRRFGDLDLSPVYRSPPVGFDGDDFLNVVTRLVTDAPPDRIQQELAEIHELAGRCRDAGRFTPRTLDIDLLLYDQLISERPEPALPRSDVLQYGFVLKPLSELAPRYRHPLTGKTLAEHWRQFEGSGHPLSRHRVIL